MESLKRKADTQATQKKETEQRTSSPLSSQLSALLFSSSPPEPKQVKMDVEQNNDEFMVENDLDDLLKELDGVEDDLFADKDMNNTVNDHVNTVNDHVMHVNNVNTVKHVNTVNNFNTVVNSVNHQIIQVSHLKEHVIEHVNTLDYCTEKDIIYSAVDSVYKSDQRLLPMIDISTPQIFSQHPVSIIKPAWEISDVESSQDMFNAGGAQFKVLLPETFNIEDLRDNIRSINPNLHLNPIEVIKQSNERRISFQLALMLRDFRQMGSMAQLRLVDGNGKDIVGTLALSACTELEFKLHFGLILILTNVSVFSPVPGQKYLNITKQNIQSFHYNISTIRDD